MIKSHADICRAAELKWRGVPPGIPSDLAALFMERLKAGSTVKKLTGGDKNCRPGMVPLGRFKKQCELQPVWGAAAWRISAINGRRGKGSHLRNRTHCLRGHLFTSDNVFIGRDGRRRCRICIAKSHAENLTMSEGQARAVVAALHAGRTIADMTRGGSPNYILNHRALLIFRQKHAKFDRFVVRLSAQNARVHRIEGAARRWQIIRSPYIAAHGEQIFQIIRAAVPDTLFPQVRQDIISAMAEDVVAGKLRPVDIQKRAGEYIAAGFRQNSKFGPRSLDARLFDDGNATLLDRLSSEGGTGYWDLNMMASTGRQK